MKSITIKGSTRKVLGKKSTKELRKQEMVPCILYGEGEDLPVNRFWYVGSIDEAIEKGIKWTSFSN